MEHSNLQQQRFEFKYILNNDAAYAVREFIRSYLDVDEYGATLPELSYPVHSLYLDSPDLKLYQSTINGDRNRFKLRLRFYENHATAPIYFEIKRRTNNTISKQRAGVRRAAVDALLAAQLLDPSHLVSRDPKQLAALQRFCLLASELNAKPVAHVAYLREAWTSRHDNSLRVTMDREVRIEPEPLGRLSTEMAKPAFVFGTDVVLELKFTNRFPNWLKELVRHFGLMQCGAAKYVDGVNLVNPRRFTNSFPAEAWPCEEDLFADEKNAHLKRRQQALASLS